MTVRMIVGWIVVIVFDDQTKSYHGPFLTESRAMAYAEGSTSIVDYTVEPLVIPHNIHLNFEGE